MTTPSRSTSLLLAALALCAAACAHGDVARAGGTAQITPDQLLLVAARAQQAGDTLRAQQYLLAALSRGVDSRRVLPWLLRLYVADGQYRSAIDRAQESLRVQRDDTPLRLLLATLYRATDLEASAAEQYEEVLRSEPTQARAHLELAMLLHDGGSDAARAEEHFRAFLRLAPDAPEAADVRSRLLKELP